MSYEIIGDKVICQNDQTQCKMSLWIGDKDVGNYTCPNCHQSYIVRGFEFANEPVESE